MILCYNNIMCNNINSAVEPGTVVVTNKAFNAFLKEEHEIVSLSTLLNSFNFCLRVEM